MLVTTDLVRDVLCNEVVELSKCIKLLTCDIQADMIQHVINLKNILTGTDFVHVPTDIRIWEIQEMAEAIVRKRQS